MLYVSCGTSSRHSVPVLRKVPDIVTGSTYIRKKQKEKEKEKKEKRKENRNELEKSPFYTEFYNETQLQETECKKDLFLISHQKRTKRCKCFKRKSDVSLSVVSKSTENN